MTNENETVLVTGGSGFIATHCILKLAAAGYKIKSTVRNLDRVTDLNEVLNKAGSQHERLNRVEVEWTSADLTKDEGWDDAVSGCKYVLHVASPVSLDVKDENELITPAREGTLRVLKAASKAKVERVVLTSSVAAILNGEEKSSYDENDWTNPEAQDCSAYSKSKTYAEKAAWDFVENVDSNLELAVINPSWVLGPILESDIGSSVQSIQMLLNGALPLVPKISFGMVDVRDVADLHVLAMTSDKAPGNRFIASANTLSMPEWTRILREAIPEYKKRLPKRTAPDLLIKFLGIFSKTAGFIAEQLGRTKQLDNSKAKNLLGWDPRSGEEALIASAKSLIELNQVKAL